MFTFDAPPNYLQDKIIMVTGASDGIGRAIATRYAELGATLILLGRNLQKLESVYDRIESQGSRQPAIIQMDLLTAAENDYATLANQIKEHFGALHGCVHCAGLLGNQTLIEQYPISSWDNVMRVNVTAPFMLSKSLIPLMRTSGDSSLIFVSSSVGRQGRAHWGAYSVSKFAVEGLCQILASELENTSKIRVNSVNPGGTRTAMRATAYPAENPNTRPAPEAITPVFEYLMGAASLGVTGQQFDAQ